MALLEVSVPAPENRPLEENRPGVDRAEDKTRDSLDTAELQEVGPQKTPQRMADDFVRTRNSTVLPELRSAPSCITLQPIGIFGEVVDHKMGQRIFENTGWLISDHVGVYSTIRVAR